MVKIRWGNYKKKRVKSEACWGDLDVNVLHRILELIPAEELFSSASLVCRQWRSICWEILFWNDHETLELSTLKHLVGGYYASYNYPRKLTKALECVMNWALKMEAQRCIRSIVFASFMYVKVTDLAFVASRSPRLRRLILPDTHSIKDVNEIAKIIQKWREVEEVSLGPILNNRTDHLFRRIGNDCKHLTKLHIFGAFATRNPTLG
ncbi:hypothetical protein CCACVL1_27484 [Corchorus capsularis]|uniref:F-box domain-containing protein n=1 Tax=Corchorus capsularis TaxID=210143 RepID=A0A1R3GA66_COCAP|nr:hypothetical protein CCACVL1_27484 [Corchorus capsularis]